MLSHAERREDETTESGAVQKKWERDALVCIFRLESVANRGICPSLVKFCWSSPTQSFSVLGPPTRSWDEDALIIYAITSLQNWMLHSSEMRTLTEADISVPKKGRKLGTLQFILFAFYLKLLINIMWEPPTVNRALANHRLESSQC
jgi:hypothetical protein